MLLIHYYICNKTASEYPSEKEISSTMRERLKAGSLVCPPKENIQYKILEQVGSGSSSLVYRAEFHDDQGHLETHLLKEYVPSRFPVHRGADNVLKPADDVQDAYQAGMDRFLAGARNIHDLRHCDGLRSSLCEILRVFPANGTVYLDMPLSEGIVYACVQEVSLEYLLQRIYALTEVVGKIHKAGLLCLDLKPGNLLVKPEDPKYMQLFDLDSAIRRDGSSCGAKPHYSQAWAPPEQKLPSLYGDICEATDLYTIGELLFCQLFGRHSRPEERNFSAIFNFQGTPLLDGAGPNILQPLEQILRHTITTSPKRRYQKASELLKALNKLLPRNPQAQEISGCGAVLHLPPEQNVAEAPPSPATEENCSWLSLTYAAIDSGDYGPVKRLARLHRVQTESLYGMHSPEYLDAVFRDAAASFSELASSLENNALPPSPLTDAFLSCLEEYLTLAGRIPSGSDPHCGGLVAFADGLRQTAYLFLELQRTQGIEQPPGKVRSLLDMAMNLAGYADDAETLIELREMVCSSPLS